MDVTDEQIRELTTLIWDTMLHRPIDPLEEALPSGVRTIAACVQITGAWRGAVAITCGAPMAAEAAEIMFSLGGAQPSVTDMQDALGELANMLGGNIKALLPEPCQLSLPHVVEGTDYSVRLPKSRLVTRLPLRCGAQPMTVSLLQSEARAA